MYRINIISKISPKKRCDINFSQSGCEVSVDKFNSINFRSLAGIVFELKHSKLSLKHKLKIVFISPIKKLLRTILVLNLQLYLSTQ